MKTPSWAIVIGIILMLFGGCGLLKNGQAIMMPQIMDMQQEMMEVAVESMDDIESDEWDGEWDEEEDVYLDSLEEEILPPLALDSNEENGEAKVKKKRRKRDIEKVKKMTSEMKKMFGISEFNRRWTIRFGYVGMFICAIYLLSGAFLANRNVFAIKFVFGALTLSIAFSIIQMLVLASDSGSGFIGRMASFGNMFGVVLDIVVLIVFAVIDKSDYFKTNQPPEPAKDDWENF